MLENDMILRLSHDIANAINKSNNIDNISPNQDGSICFIESRMFMFIELCGNKARDGNYQVTFLYGNEEETIFSFDFNSYDDFVKQVVIRINRVFNKKIKIVVYSEKRKCHGKKYFFLNSDNQWELYDSFILNGWFSRLFIMKTYQNEDVYDFVV